MSAVYPNCTGNPTHSTQRAFFQFLPFKVKVLDTSIRTCPEHAPPSARFFNNICLSIYFGPSAGLLIGFYQTFYQTLIPTVLRWLTDSPVRGDVNTALCTITESTELMYSNLTVILEALGFRIKDTGLGSLPWRGRLKPKSGIPGRLIVG